MAYIREAFGLEVTAFTMRDGERASMALVVISTGMVRMLQTCLISRQISDIRIIRKEFVQICMYCDVSHNLLVIQTPRWTVTTASDFPPFDVKVGVASLQFTVLATSRYRRF